MRVRVLFFGVLRDIAGVAEDRLDMPENATLGAIFDHYAQLFPRLRQMSASIVMARNQAFAARGDSIADGDEVALLPPVSGGAGKWTHAVVDDPPGCLFALTREPIDAAALARSLVRGEDGAVVNFEGVVRNNTKGRPTSFLDYECYEPMAIRVLAGIGAGLVREFAVGRVALVHRLGRMNVGETSVAVVVSAPHRRPAFDAALEGINRLKRLVPIWKKEHFADGEVWVDGEWDSSVAGR
ncbi:MAG TPA: molybdenum cofactor biosynthesis protein MoaE [Bryobacteraceae bacterium]|nr:molybdenum cofactor biosynthesis protein MoaE [Bryobacteraceae bacterium]